MVADHGDGGRRRFESYPSGAEALQAAENLAKRLDRCDYAAVSLTKEQLSDYNNAMQMLQPLGLSLTSAVMSFAEAIKHLGDYQDRDR